MGGGGGQCLMEASFVAPFPFFFLDSGVGLRVQGLGFRVLSGKRGGCLMEGQLRVLALEHAGVGVGAWTCSCVQLVLCAVFPQPCKKGPHHEMDPFVRRSPIYNYMYVYTHQTTCTLLQTLQPPLDPS